MVMTVDFRETKLLLAEASAVDNRVVSDIAVAAWCDILCDIRFEAARVALREHRRTSTEYLQPAHILALAKKHVQRTDRGLARPPAPPGKRYAVDVIEYGELE